MEQDRISARQLYAMLFTGLLTPAVRVLPGLTAAVADKSAWLTGLLAFPPLLAAGWAVYTLSRGEGGLAGGFRRAFGPAAGKAVTIIYMLWALFLLCLEGRLYAGRMVTAGYRGASPAVFLLVLLGAALWMARRRLCAFARAARICFLVLSLILALVVGFSLLDARPRRVLPVWTQDLPAAAAAAFVPVGVLSGAVLGGFLAGQVTPEGNSARLGRRWLLGTCIAMTLLQLGAMAQLGASLCARVEVPFFEMARGVGMDGAFQRVESIVVAFWVLSDFVWLGTLLFAIRSMAESLLGPKWARRSPVLAALLAVPGALFLFPDDFSARSLGTGLVPAGQILLAFGLPFLALLCRKLRERGGGKGPPGG